MPLSPDSLDTQNAPAGRGSVVSQGVALHGADAWHTAGYTGAGVKVGMISLGFAGFSTLMGSELPMSVTVRCYTDVGEFSSNLTDCESGESSHGVSVAETLLDIAPGVDLYISNPASWGDLKAAVDWMVSQDVDVVNHSISWLWSGPPDGTSPYATSPLVSVDAAVSGGAMWAGSAGNEGISTWFGAFENPDSDIWLNFSGGGVNSERPDATEYNPVSLDAGEELTVALRWQGPWTHAPIDLDLRLYDSAGAAVAGGIAFQDGSPSHRSFEWFSYTPEVGGEYRLAVNLYEGEAPEWVQVMAFTSQELGVYTRGGSITSPAESPNEGLLAAGAAHWWDVNTLANYSGRGPTPDGRIKPDITGAHCAATVSDEQVTLANGFGAWFCGTSQSSAHVAGLAALVKQGFPTHTPHQIADYLKTHAQPRGTKPNNDWGHGFARLPAPPQTTAPVGGDLAGRVGALEQQMGALQRLMLNIQSLIQALHNRLDSLEQGGGVAPVATPTPTATATPSPTPTRVSRPAPTPVSSDACVQPIGDPFFTGIDGTSFYGIGGTWTTACVTANPPNRDSDTRYAKFYTFAVSAEAEVSITLTSGEPNYLYLLSGAGRHGAIVQRVGDTPSWTNTITATLQPGSYTIEATTYYPRAIDSFTLVMTIDTGDPGYQFYLPSPTPTPLAAACVKPIEPGSTSGAWTPACVSVSRGDTYYAKFYTFTLTQASTVTITLTSEDVPDTYLYLLDGAGGNGAILHHNDDIDTDGGDFGSRISENLPAGIYTIEATTNYRNVTGNFTLELSVRR